MTKTFFTQWNERKIKKSLPKLFLFVQLLLPITTKVENLQSLQYSSLRFWFKETIWYEYLCNRKLLNIFFQIFSNYLIQYRKFFGIREKGAVQRILHTSTCSESYPHSKGNQRNTEELIDMYYMLCIVGIQKYHAHTAYGMLSLCRKYAVYQLEPSFPIFSSEEGRRRADNKIPKPGTRKMKTVNSL